MCLKNCSLALTYSKEDRCFVGVGYKVIEYKMIQTISEWTRCSGSRMFNPSFNRPKFDSTAVVTADDFHKYYPGFHIFLNMEDAVNYYNLSAYSSYKYCRYRIIEVRYKNVVAFGSNSTRLGYFSPESCGPCVVSEYIKYVKTIPFKQIKS